MQGYIVNRPDEGAMDRILQKNFQNAAGAVLRLAWQAGLLRDEIQRLTWDQVDLPDQLLLPDRTVPLAPELADWLAALRDSRDGRSETVVLSDRDRRPLMPQSISRLARRALDEEGQTAVRLIDLRHDFLLRQLETHNWQYVSRVTGVEAAALKVHFAAYLEEKTVSTRIRRKAPAEIDEFALWKLLRSERTTPAGVALWLTWQMGLRLGEIVTLTWEQVDGRCIRLPDREVPLTSGVEAIFRDLRGEGPASGPALRAPRSGRAYEWTRLSKLVRAALVRGGLDDLTLRDLRMDCQLRTGGESQILTLARRCGSVTRAQVAELMGVSKSAAYDRLHQLVCRGKLTQVGARYYLPEAVVPPERHEAAVVSYLEREGFAYRQDIAELLHIQPKQCTLVLRRLVEAGELVQSGQRYALPTEETRRAE